jgi:hypothetical protein
MPPPDIAWGMIGEKRNVRKGADRFYQSIMLKQNQNIMLKQKDNAGVRSNLLYRILAATGGVDCT